MIRLEKFAGQLKVESVPRFVTSRFIYSGYKYLQANGKFKATVYQI